MTDSGTSNNPKKNIDTKRRAFLKKAWIALGVIGIAEVFYLIFRSSAGTKKDKTTQPQSSKFFDAGPVTMFKPNTTTSFRSNHFYLCRLADGGFIALSIRCTHLGCSINWDETSKKFICPCHSSWFDMKGDVKQSPATRPLSVHEVIIKKNRVMVNLQKTIKRNSIENTKIVYTN